MVNKIDLLSDDEFIELIKRSSCTTDVLRSLKYSISGNSWAYRIIAERMDKLNITFGTKYTTKRNKIKQIELKEIITENSSYNRTKLKKRLIESGIKEYKCECCGISTWLGKPITLQLHHLNGIHNDNRLLNLQLLCPNCLTQTGNFGTKGKGLVIKRKCDSLPIKDKKVIMNTVRTKGIVEARKVLPYRNSLINAVVKANRDIYVMICLDGSEKEFNTSYEASKYLFEVCSIGKNIDSCRSSISKCISGKQKSIKGYKFYKRSLGE